ncbi:hypothetical protein CTAM01_02286 [Colletotrichum tamarilloi]|uniref:Uncharacterized protein n=1 Tax=Colletotrichum tamarilloi TaxID=1209934 RepID=A0ABQ9RPG8_9PEZI|nr:uncharacterized protein CTAM01_02286 [Colletotrichum tamarilloi]KAK1508500.1 hypothetical protein CTAM01_02286 [Colletotrichum tamarilloi]
MIPHSHILVGTRITSCISTGRYWQPPSCLMIEHMMWKKKSILEAKSMVNGVCKHVDVGYGSDGVLHTRPTKQSPWRAVGSRLNPPNREYCSLNPPISD